MDAVYLSLLGRWEVKGGGGWRDGKRGEESKQKSWGQKGRYGELVNEGQGKGREDSRMEFRTRAKEIGRRTLTHRME